jgi:hypothetical protein
MAEKAVNESLNTYMVSLQGDEAIILSAVNP